MLGPAYHAPALEHLRLELDQVPLQRLLEPGERRLDPLGRAAQRRLALAGGRRLRVAARPALEQAAEGERRDLAGPQLRDQPLRGRGLGCAFLEHVGPRRLIPDAQTSTSTGRIIGRRPVRS